MTTQKVDSERNRATVEAWLMLCSLAICVITALVAVVGATQSIRQRALLTVVAAILTVVIAALAVLGSDRPRPSRVAFRILGLVAMAASGVFFGWLGVAFWTADDRVVSSASQGVPVLEVLGIALGSVLLVLGIKRVELSGYWKTVIGVADLALLAVGVLLLGWLGFVIVVVVHVVALVVQSVRLAIRQQSILTYAAIQLGCDRAEVEELHRSLRGRKAFGPIGPIETAELISTLSQRARSIGEISVMSPPIAMLHVVHESELVDLATRFDLLLRRSRKRPAEAMQVADQLTVATKQSAATFDETLDAMLALTSEDVP